MEHQQEPQGIHDPRAYEGEERLETQEQIQTTASMFQERVQALIGQVRSWEQERSHDQSREME